jgi:hypothetical protein
MWRKLESLLFVHLDLKHTADVAKLLEDKLHNSHILTHAQLNLGYFLLYLFQHIYISTEIGEAWYSKGEWNCELQPLTYAREEKSSIPRLGRIYQPLCRILAEGRSPPPHTPSKSNFSHSCRPPVPPCPRTCWLGRRRGDRRKLDPPLFPGPGRRPRPPQQLGSTTRCLHIGGGATPAAACRNETNQRARRSFCFWRSHALAAFAFSRDS